MAEPRKSQAPKTHRTDTILPEHLLAHTLNHTLITYLNVYSHYYIWSFCHHFPCKKWCFNHQYADRIFKPRNIAVAYTNCLSIASCRIVNRRYRNDLLVTEIRVVVLIQDIKSLAYRSLVRPSLEYCAAVWDPHTNDLIYQLEAVQRRAARFVKNDYDRQSSVTTMMKELDWGTLADRRKIAKLAVFHKAHEGHLSIPVRNLLHPVTRPTRRTHNKSYIEIRANKDTFKYSFLPRTLTDWNSLPSTLVNPKNLKHNYRSIFNKQIFHAHTAPGSSFSTRSVEL